MAYFRKYNYNELVTAVLNINFLRNNFELLTEKAKRNVDILLTKIAEIFLKTDSFHYPYWVDHNEKGGQIRLIFREELPLNILLVWKDNEMIL